MNGASAQFLHMLPCIFIEMREKAGAISLYLFSNRLSQQLAGYTNS